MILISDPLQRARIRIGRRIEGLVGQTGESAALCVRLRQHDLRRELPAQRLMALQLSAVFIGQTALGGAGKH